MPAASRSAPSTSACATRSSSSTPAILLWVGGEQEAAVVAAGSSPSLSSSSSSLLLLWQLLLSCRAGQHNDANTKPNRPPATCTTTRICAAGVTHLCAFPVGTWDVAAAGRPLGKNRRPNQAVAAKRKEEERRSPLFLASPLSPPSLRVPPQHRNNHRHFPFVCAACACVWGVVSCGVVSVNERRSFVV